MGVLQFIGKVITTSALVFVIVVLVPGVPPDVEFEVINAKPQNGQVKIVTKFGQDCEGEWDMLKCGRVAGLRFDSKGTLFAADVALGIFKVDVDTGAYERIVPMDIPIDGKLIKFADDLDIDKDGFIYFSDASTNVDPTLMILELIGRPSGRLVQFDPKTGTSKVLIDN